MDIQLTYEFIENELVIAPPVYTVIYIYAYKKFINNEDLTVSLLAENIIGLVEKDIINALNFWQKKNLIFFDGENITFNNESVNKMEEISFEILEPEIKSRNFLIDSKPIYKMEELEFYRKNSNDVDKLYTFAEKAFGKLLSSSDISTLFSFYDWLRLPVEVIEVLVDYCVQNGNANIRYMEKVALDWHEKNLNTMEKAKEYLKKMNKDYRNIFKALGIDRELTELDIELFEKWENIYGFSNELILEACDKAILTASKPTLKYVNGILENWHRDGIKTLEDVEVHENKFFEEQKDKSQKSVSTTTTVKNKFSNFTQEEINFNDIAAKERERLKKLYNKE